ncbi:UNVERIFIED_CONTAM: Retrovirus-related Pol polyprotein from transposon TNT 1-94 [Sesamum radiatum]|uniref:Retrovirus-related Pol polyprotein from transposon TNT 1-94 n=1 Tax=Sesamum radiatum TaxID=300843 RepID=A0AAW2KCA7_SESRA
MKGILIQQKVFKAIDGRYTENISEEKRLENDEFAYSSIILNLSDSVIRKDIKLTGDKNIDDYTPIVLLNAIPETYSDVKAAIKYGRDNVSLDTVINGLKSKEMDIKTNKTNQSTSEVNFVRGRTKNRNPDYKYRKGGRSRSRSKSRSKSRGRDERPRDDSKHDGDDANFVSDSNGEVYMISDINNVQSSVNMHEWLIDSGCSFHMSPYKEIFSNYKTDNFGFVAMANEKLCGIKGLGDVCVTFDNDDKASLWHRRLGHISLKGLDLLHKNGLLPDKFKDLNFCDDCVLGKQHKVHFPASPYPNSPTSNDILDYVHADVWGPSNVETHGGNNSGLPKFFWGEALLTAAYLVNRSPSVPLLGKTPECVWSKSDIDLSSLRIFGCAAFALVNGNKLDPRSQKCVFIGYPEGVKGYRLWVRDQPGLRVVISRNVVFNESEFPCLTKIPRTEEEYNIELTFNKVEETNEDNQQGEGFREETRDIEAGQTNRNSENPEHIDNYSLARDRERRERRIPSRFRDFHLALNSEDSEPTSYDDALKSPKSEFWIKAMKEEMKSLKDNKTWVLVPKPKNTSIVDSKWIFKLKNENDSLRYKARNPEHVCLLKKSLYGLKQSPRQWNKKFDNFMKTLMFHKSAYDPCLYFKFVNNAPIFLVLYVDDMLIASPDLSMIEKLQNDLRKTFEMKDLGNAKKILGMTIDRDRKTSSIFLNQKAYVISVLEKFSMINAKSSSVPLAPHFQLSKDQSPKSDSEKKLMEKVPYSNAIGSVMYLMVCTRPDIAYAVSCLSRYMSNAGPPHWEALKWLLRYLSGSANTGTCISLPARRRPAMMIARDPYLGPGSSPQVLVQGGE